jgi:hypothetical protein
LKKASQTDGESHKGKQIGGYYGTIYLALQAGGGRGGENYTEKPKSCGGSGATGSFAVVAVQQDKLKDDEYIYITFEGRSSDDFPPKEFEDGRHDSILIYKRNIPGSNSYYE